MSLQLLVLQFFSGALFAVLSLPFLCLGEEKKIIPPSRGEIGGGGAVRTVKLN